ncbi:MAG: GldG family protein [Planctomycetota bacterium]
MIDETEIKDAEFTIKETNTPNSAAFQPAEGWGKKQKTITFFNVLVMVLIALVILIGVNYVSQRRYFRIDCTFKQEYSISIKSKGILKQLKEPIIIYTFFVPPQDAVMAEIQRMMTDLLEEYKIYSHGKISVENIAVLKNPERVAAIRETKLKPGTIISENDVILRSGTNQKNFNLVETYERDEGPYGRTTGIKAFKGEEVFTSAIMTIIQTKKIILYFVTGHGEGEIKDNNTGDGYAIFVNYLQGENMDCKEVNLAQIAAITDDCSTLIIPGPRKPISMPEKNIINNYLKNGGRVFIMIDPLVETGLTDLLAEWGIKTENGIVIDAEKYIPLIGPHAVSIEDYPKHKITEKMGSAPTNLFVAGAVESITPTLATEIMKSSAKSWLKTDMDAMAKGQLNFNKDTDKKGPISVGVAVSKKEGEREIRMVVVGDADMVKNQYINPNSPIQFGTVDFALNAIRWLTGQESFISIEPKKIEAKRIELTPARITFLFWFSMIIIPAIGAVLGIFMWLIRRR